MMSANRAPPRPPAQKGRHRRNRSGGGPFLRPPERQARARSRGAMSRSNSSRNGKCRPKENQTDNRASGSNCTFHPPTCRGRNEALLPYCLLEKFDERGVNHLRIVRVWVMSCAINEEDFATKPVGHMTGLGSRVWEIGVARPHDDQCRCADLIKSCFCGCVTRPRCRRKCRPVSWLREAR